MSSLGIFPVVLLMALYCVEISADPASLNVQKYFDEQIQDSTIPGIQYLILNSNHILYEYTGGWADIALKKPMHPNTTMMAYSQTKTITALAILQLYEARKLNLEDNIDLYIPNLPYKAPITIHQLLSQTSGLPNPIPLRWAHLSEEHQSFDESAALSQIIQDNPDLSFTPGEKYEYSNISYWLLGNIIEIVSGQKYEDYVRQHILTPLNITPMELSFTITDPKKHAKGYLEKYSLLNLFKGFLIDDKLIGEKSHYEGDWLHIQNHYLNGPAFGGLIGTSRGFGKILQDQLEPKSVLINNETKKLFYTQQTTNNGDPIDMTLGWHIGYTNNTKYFFKEGGGAGFHSEMRIYPAQGIASVIMVNKTKFKPKAVLDSIDKTFFPLSTN